MDTKGWLFISVLSGLMAFTSLSTDIYLPAMPEMGRDLQGDAELTITGFLIGFSFAQLFWGAISDKIGRKIPLIVGMILFVIGSVGCTLATSMYELLAWRVFQAFGACVGPMLSRAMIRDLYSRAEAAKMLSTLAIVMAIAPIAGPMLAGHMLLWYSWHSIFWLLVVIGVIMLTFILFLPETHPEERRSHRSMAATYGNYWILLRNKGFMKYTLCVTSFYMAIYAFLTASPYVYIDVFHVPKENFGYLFALNIIGVMLLSAVNRRIVSAIRLDRLLRYSTMFSALCVIVVLALMLAGFTSLTLIVVGCFLFFSMNGIIAAVTNALALDRAGRIAGSGAALLGAMQYGSGIVSSLILTVLPNDSPIPMMMVIGVFVIISAIIAYPEDERYSRI
ncbi:multidrug effflux MFS transporter [Veillonella agrestimuris]|uniref:multidrug effflux MFS transporter n=1 Tax=Veillonella agrestimuris TaxID=2941340 RepID=UPI00203BAD86|nr:multidrug effflux MFS transporter [Veillonella agrestimuris]